MPLTLLQLPDLDESFWAQPEIVEAVCRGQLDEFFRSVRGARRPRWSQDQMARWLGCNQSTISDIENGRAPVTHARLDATFTALRVPANVVTRWASGA
jgi:hypothetical protein